MIGITVVASRHQFVDAIRLLVIAMNFSCHQKTREPLKKIVPEFKETRSFRSYGGEVSTIRFAGKPMGSAGNVTGATLSDPA
jgi:hypothetical protein